MKKSRILAGIGTFAAVAAASAGAACYKIACVSKREHKPETEPKKILRTEVRKRNNAFLQAHNPEDLEIITPDGLRLRAWYVPAERTSNRFLTERL